MAELESHDFGLKKASKNSIVYPTLKKTRHAVRVLLINKSRHRKKFERNLTKE